MKINHNTFIELLMFCSEKISELEHELEYEKLSPAIKEALISDIDSYTMIKENLYDLIINNIK